jgi:hypothetical protein
MKALAPFLMMAMLIGLLSACSSENSQPTSGVDSTTQPKTLVGTVTINVHKSESEVDTYPEILVQETLSVREVLIRAAKSDSSFTFTDTMYPAMGHLLTSLMGVRNASGGGKYWQFCIDNVASDRGIDEKQLGPGQSLDWHFVDYGKLPCKKIGE